MEQGWSIFDFPPAKVESYREDWLALTQWLDLLLAAAPAMPGSHLERPETVRHASHLQSQTRAGLGSPP